MTLFGTRGYNATSVAQIEEAAGLRPGSGGLYRHFASKRQLLEDGIREQLASQGELLDAIGDPALFAALPLTDRLAAVAGAALDRLASERDLNRIILRDLDRFPDLLDLVRAHEMARIQALFARWLPAQTERPPELDWDAVAAMLIGSISHFWLLQDIFGTHPSGLDAERYLRGVAETTARILDMAAPPSAEITP